MMSRILIGTSRALVTLALVIAFPVARLRAQARAATPTLILTGGRIFTVDSTRPWADAVAIRGERILAVGSDAEVKHLAGKHTREIALGGRVVIPGINDAHDHVGDIPMPGEFSTSTSPTPDPMFAEVLDSIRIMATRTPRGTWIKTTIGLGVLDDTSARRAALDRVAPDHPVFLWTWWGHGAVLNSEALRALGIAESAPDPLGGWYERAAGGRLTGRLDEYAEWGALRRMYSMQPERALVAGVGAFADSSLRVGVTTVQSMAGDLAPSLMLRVMHDANPNVRVRLIRWSIPDARGRNEQEWNLANQHPASRVVVSGRKWVIDGTPIERNALRRSAYTGAPTPAGPHGRLDFPLDTVRAILAAALLPRAQQLHLHVVGDSTPGLVIALMESMAPDSVWRTKRVRFEHASGLLSPLVKRVHNLGIVIAQPRDGTPLKTWMSANIPLAYGSDNLRNPFYNMMAAVGGGRPGTAAEALTREQAVTMYTLGSAYAEFGEREKGSIAPGKLADLAVLSQDIFTVPLRALPGTTSVLTIVGGIVMRDVLRKAVPE
jgi:predicted amidohydrolase YtcJ